MRIPFNHAAHRRAHIPSTPPDLPPIPDAIAVGFLIDFNFAYSTAGGSTAQALPLPANTLQLSGYTVQRGPEFFDVGANKILFPTSGVYQVVAAVQIWDSTAEGVLELLGSTSPSAPWTAHRHGDTTGEMELLVVWGPGHVDAGAWDKLRVLGAAGDHVYLRYVSVTKVPS